MAPAHPWQADSSDDAAGVIEADWRRQDEDGEVVVQSGGVGLGMEDDGGH